MLIRLTLIVRRFPSQGNELETWRMFLLEGLNKSVAGAPRFSR